MVAVELATLAVAAVASLFMAWAIGAGSSGSTPFAPAVGANAVSILRAAFVVGILGFLGATVQGANVSATVGTGLVEGVTLSSAAAATVLLVAATLVAIGVYTGYPIATAFTVTGAVVGVGLALGGTPAWATYRRIAALWLLTPVVGGGLAYATVRLLDGSIPERRAVPALAGVVGVLLANVEFTVLGPPGTGRSAAVAVATTLPLSPVLGRLVVSAAFGAAAALLLGREVAADRARAQRRLLLALGGLVAFSAGGSQVGLAVGPLLPLVGDRVPLVWMLAGGGLGLLAGSWTGAPRMIKAIARDYSSLGATSSIGALVPSFVIAQTAVLFGIPVSFNEIIVSAIVGSGYAASGAGVSRGKMGYTVLAWVGSLALAGALGYGVFAGIRLLT